MKSTKPFVTTLALLVLVALPVTADHHLNQLTAEEKADGWELLFDGESLDGWMSWKNKKPLNKGAWAVKEGTLALTGRGGGSIYSAKAFENYEFKIEWKTMGNSGLLFRVDPTHKGAMWNKAPEMQVNNGNPKSRGSTSAGGLYALYDFTEDKVFHPNDWNSVRVLCRDDHFTVWFNGRKAHEFTIGSDDWNQRVAKSKFKKYEGFGMLKKGHLGLQDHGNKVQFRNIKIRVIK